MKGLSKKQEKVKSALENGKTPTQVAKSMGISTAGVYGHIRRIQAKGFEVSRLENASRKPEKAKAAPEKQSKAKQESPRNGVRPAGHIAEGIQDLIRFADDREKQIQEELSVLIGQRNSVEDQCAKLQEEAATLNKQRHSLEKALH